MTEISKFERLLALNVNGKTEKKKTGNSQLTYLSWTYAWSEFKKVYPEATYEVKFFNGLPYTFDEKTGYMVFTSVTADGLTHEMWLPVMDGANKAMKADPYTYTTKYAEKSVEAASMFDINKAIMRCLVKNLAMFGLGLYIYAGEDLPEENEEIAKEKKEEASKKVKEQQKALDQKLMEQLDRGMKKAKDLGADIEQLSAWSKIPKDEAIKQIAAWIKA